MILETVSFLLRLGLAMTGATGHRKRTTQELADADAAGGYFSVDDKAERKIVGSSRKS